jgi:hypothetical protein
MKFTELNEEKQLFAFTRIEEHTKKVQNDSLSSLEAAINYLFLTNSGGAVAVLGFLGTSQRATNRLGPLTALAFFAIGLILVGVIKAFRLHYSAKFLKSWTEQVNKFLRGEINWEEAMERCTEVAREPLWPYVVGYSSFLCFVVGASIGFGLLWTSG